jgi:hypothetical protein
VVTIITLSRPELPGIVVGAITFGDSEIPTSARRRIRLNAESWSGWMGRDKEAVRWKAGPWPLGGMAAAALAAPEAFKAAMRNIYHVMRNPARLETVFADMSAASPASIPARP